MPSLPCPPVMWPRFSALLDDALELPECARAGWLAALGGGDAALRPGLARVLAGAVAASSPSFLAPRLGSRRPRPASLQKAQPDQVRPHE